MYDKQFYRCNINKYELEELFIFFVLYLIVSKLRFLVFVGVFCYL